MTLSASVALTITVGITGTAAAVVLGFAVQLVAQFRFVAGHLEASIFHYWPHRQMLALIPAYARRLRRRPLARQRDRPAGRPAGRALAAGSLAYASCVLLVGGILPRDRELGESIAKRIWPGSLPKLFSLAGGAGCGVSDERPGRPATEDPLLLPLRERSEWLSSVTEPRLLAAPLRWQPAARPASSSTTSTACRPRRNRRSRSWGRRRAVSSRLRRSRAAEQAPHARPASVLSTSTSWWRSTATRSWSEIPRRTFPGSAIGAKPVDRDPLSRRRLAAPLRRPGGRRVGPGRGDPTVLQQRRADRAATALRAVAAGMAERPPRGRRGARVRFAADPPASSLLRRPVLARPLPGSSRPRARAPAA